MIFKDESESMVLTEVVREMFGKDHQDYADYITGHYDLISQMDIIDLITHAPCSLQKKYEWFSRLAMAYPSPEDRVYKPGIEKTAPLSYAFHRDMVFDAINSLKTEGDSFFVLEEWNLNDSLEDIMYGYEIANSLDSVKRLIQAEYGITDDMILGEKLLELEHVDTDDMGLDEKLREIQKLTYTWQRLKKYEKNDAGKFVETYQYHMLGSEVCWFSNKKDCAEVIQQYHLALPAFGVPCPYKSGDIVEVDCRPFAPVRHAVVLTNPLEQVWDCCNPWVLYIDKDGHFATGAFNHNCMIREYNLHAPGAFYGAKVINDEASLTSDEKDLWEIGNLINGNEKCGRWIDEYFNHHRGRISLEELMDAMNQTSFCKAKLKIEEKEGI